MLFTNAIAFLASFESLSRVGIFQIVGWPRYARLCAPNWKHRLHSQTLSDFIFDSHFKMQ